MKKIKVYEEYDGGGTLSQTLTVYNPNTGMRIIDHVIDREAVEANWTAEFFNCWVGSGRLSHAERVEALEFLGGDKTRISCPKWMEYTAKYTAKYAASREDG